MPRKKTKAAADPRVKEQLEAEGIPYDIYKDGVYVVAHLESEDDEPILVFINSETEVIYGEEGRDITSVAMTNDGPLEAELAHDLLFRNALSAVGGWRIFPADSTDLLIVFHTRIPADCKPEVLSESLSLVIDEVNSFRTGVIWESEEL